MQCPSCSADMASGVLALNGSRLLLASAEWEPDRKGDGRRTRLLEPGPLGLHTRPAWRCLSCETVVLPPTQDDDDTSSRHRTVVRDDGAPTTWASLEERTDEDPLRP